MNNLTKEEASKLVCPVMSDYENGINCIADNCMAWTWVETKSKCVIKAVEIRPDYFESVPTTIQVPIKGICGLKNNITE